MAYLLYVQGATATEVAQSQVLENAEAERQLMFGIGANEKLLPIAESVTITAGRVINGITLNADSSEITAVTYADAVLRSTASIKAEAKVHLRSRMDEMKWIWGPTGQRWRNCRLWLISMAVVIKGICDVLDDSTHAEHANWSVSDAIDALEAAKALAPAEIPADRLAVLATALNLPQPLDTLGVRFWYFGHGEVAWTGYFGAIDDMSPPDPNHGLDDEQHPHFAWKRGADIPGFASDANAASEWGSNLDGRLNLEFDAVTAEIEGILV